MRKSTAGSKIVAKQHADAACEKITITARFQPGDRVRVRVDDPPRHIRTPAYIQGKIGRIAAVHGAFPNPETRAHGADGLPKQPLYLVSFDGNAVWERAAAPSQDRLLIDLYEHWLERV